MKIYIIGQVLAVIGYLIYYASRYCGKKEKMVLVEAISKFITVISFGFLGNASGVFSNVITMSRSVAIYQKEKHKKKYTGIFIVIILACIICSCFTYTNIFSCFAYVAAIITTTVSWYGTPQKIRFWGIIASIFYLIFQIASKNLMGSLFECGTMISALTSYIAYARKDYCTENVE